MSQMSLLARKPILRKFVVALGSAVLAILGIVYIQAFVKMDPLAKLRADAGRGLADRIGIRLNNVDLIEWNRDKVVSQAHVQRVDVSKDRQLYDLYHVTNGVYYLDKAKLNFTADRGQYLASQKLMEVTSGAHIISSDFDLQVPNFRINTMKSTVYVPGHIEGKAYKGDVIATNFLYNLKDHSAVVGPIEWKGKVSMKLQDDEGKPEFWQIRGKSSTFKNDHGVYTEGWASNGDTIVKGPKMEQDRKNEIITATGGVFYFSKKVNMTCDKVVIYQKEKRAVLTGHVNMLVKPKEQQDTAKEVEIPPFKPFVPSEVKAENPPAPTGKNDQEKQLDKDVQSTKTIRKYPMAVTSDKIEYWYKKGNRHAIITGNPQARQELPGGRWRHCWTHEAFYDGEAETLKLVSSQDKKDTRVVTSLGDDLQATDITVSTKEDDDSMDATDIVGRYASPGNDDTGSGSTPPPPDKTKKPPPLHGAIGNGTTAGAKKKIKK